MKTLRNVLKEERGSALLVSLMVMVGLSLLGLGFIAISETESAIAINERNYSQMVNVAEAAAKVAVEWFQDPDWALARGLMPENKNVFKRERYKAPGSSIGRYKADLTMKLFDKPFKNIDGKFFGLEDSPDVLVDRTTADGRAFLDEFNEKVFPNAGADGEITEFRIFAPPIIGATLVTQGTDRFYDGGIRYGLATIRVTATKFNISRADATAQGIDPETDRRVIAQRSVKYIVSEWPFPGPNGPIQSNANIATGGNFGVHWGKMTAQGTLEIGRALVSLPWMGAYDWSHFEHGYDSSNAWQPNRTYVVGELVHPTAPTAAQEKYCWVVTTAGTTAATEPTWPEAPATVGPTTGEIVTSGSVQFRTRWASNYKNQPGALPISWATQFDWLYEYLEKEYQDPWFQARARGDITNEGSATPQPYQYISPLQDEIDAPFVGYSNWFQFQDTNRKDLNRREVIFPRIDYNFWKEIAISGSGTTAGVKYLRWVADDRFTDGVQTKIFAHWVNIDAGAEAGFYFFDTRNAQNPQGPGAAGILTPPIAINSADANPFGMQGFIYVNAENFYTKGINGLETNVNMPGEPYADVGFRRACCVAGDDMTGQTSGEYWVDSLGNFDHDYAADNGQWDFQDLNGNGRFDVYVTSRTVPRPGGGTVTTWLPVIWYPGCSPGSNVDETGAPTAGFNCSEPHEPYVNLLYPDEKRTGGSGTPPTPLMAKWEDPAAQTHKPKLYSAGTTPVDCATSTNKPRDCTSNAWDRDGGIVPFEAVLDGVMYNEGNFTDTTGNADYFGSLLINGSVGKAGNAEVWFDEKLVKGDWPPKRFKFPRVYVSATQTDQ